ncbi:type I secretion system permease/ATPase [Kalamiella sp. sgz302252]|uniref:type I secretion system permease/ATPase n=1 Tax=Pantoea sp. sgz302252 TaxID=3341827 RepID=UPI0036D2D26C
MEIKENTHDTAAYSAELHAPELVKVVEYAIRLFNLRASPHEIQDGLPAVAAGSDQAIYRRWLLDAFQKSGLQAAWQSAALQALNPAFLPAVLELNESFIVLCEYGEKECRVILPELGSHPVAMDTAALALSYSGRILLFRPLHHDDRRADDLIVTRGKHWFWSTLWNFRRYIAEAAALSVVINMLALAMSIFTMTVYNRVLPNQTYVTLWTLAIGVSMALVFELAARLTRAWITDRAGKKIDLLLGARIFRHVLNGRMENRAQSNGAFGNVMQSFESVRDLVTSAALTAVADLPFVLLFLLVIWFVAGPLVWCVLLILLTVAGIALLMQIPLRRHAEASMKIGSNRHGLVMETLDNLETIKALRAENHLAAKHDTASVRLSAVSMKARFLSTAGTTLIQLIQQFGTVGLLVWGAYLVGDGEISMGGIIATMTLMGRAIMPVSTLAALALRFQQARTSFQILEKFMAAEPEYSRDKVYVQLPTGAAPEILCSGLSLRYKPDLPPVIDNLALKIQPGEKIAILGKIGSGKSSLLRLLVGLYQPTAGSVTLAGVDTRQISPAELRSQVALVSQDARMMFGTLRDNLLLGAPSVSDEEMMRAAEMTGVNDIAAAHPMGYGMPIGERGDNLSGGQKQAISLTRALLGRPQILLLDEPTSGMDMGSERAVLEAISSAIAGRTVVIVTHRPAILQYVDRVIVMDGGMKVADGEKQQVLELLNSGKVPSASALRNQQAYSGVVEA